MPSCSPTVSLALQVTFTAARYTIFTLIVMAAGLMLTPLLFITAGQLVTGGSDVLIFWGLAAATLILAVAAGLNQQRNHSPK
ncbi:hypothetical protein [Erwinia persicina]|uniref:hypothetical protein n=1 Tax=Erwinia persicina TaxID=55211 RepID=UPI00177D456D|nr:hypothetical protein [Erwinia persicina]MBD8165195.1 hypothetical protein [Erwinia persicina]MBD8215918.1 hypothetical protein [Erwinia persicina]